MKIFDSKISMTFDISELPESKYYVHMYVCICVCSVCLCVCVINLCALYLKTGQRYQVYLWQVYKVYFEVVQVQLYS